MYFQWYRYCFSKYFTFQGRASRVTRQHKMTT